ncbi:MAG: response regulator transcription factor [Bacteroidota bacterium]
MVKSVCILETSFIVNEGLKHIVSGLTDFEIKAHFETLPELEKSTKIKACNLLVCNPDLIKNSHTLTKLKINNPSLKILVVDQEKNAYKDFFTPASVDGYIFLCCHTEEVLKALLAVTHGEKFFCDKALGYILSSKSKMQSCNPINLSEREIEILKLIVKGHSSKEISELINVSIHTVNTHRKNMFRKLKVNKVNDLIATAHKLKIG